MARDASLALGGFFESPSEVLPGISAMCARGPGDHYSVVDPCAGKGEALVAFSRAILDPVWSRVYLYGIELETTRAAKLAALSKGKAPLVDDQRLDVLRGDAFAAEWTYDGGRTGNEHGGPSALLLNPPYHEGRMELRFLDRFTGALKAGGVLVFIVPYMALVRCASTLAQHYDVKGCYRFPEPLFTQDPHRAFKQIVLYAVRRGSLLDPDPKMVARVMGWGTKPDTIPVLPEAGTAKPIVTLLGHQFHRSGYATWRMRPSDNEGLLAQFKPFHASTKSGGIREVTGMIPPSMAEMVRRRYPVATPLKPAHIATAIAAGVFNGEMVTPDDTDQGWPNILVKGNFDREFVEIDEKVNKDGQKTASVKVQQPKLRVTVLDLSMGSYHTLVDSDEESDACTVDRLTTADLLAVYGRSLLRVMLANCPAVHDPKIHGEDIAIAEVTRPLYLAQAHTVRAVVKLLGGDKPIVVPQRARWRGKKTIAQGIFAGAVRRHYQGKTAVLLGEAGSGKSACALATMKTIAGPVIERGGIWRTLVLVPPHLLKSWRDQARAVTPEARLIYLTSIADVDELASNPRPGMTIAVLSRETGKLGHAWDGIQHSRLLLGLDQREGCGATVSRPAHRVTHARLVVRALDDDAEVWGCIEESRDGRHWKVVAAFAEMTQPGEQPITIECSEGARYVRAVWSSSGPATFAIYDAVAPAAVCPRCGTETPKPEKAMASHREELARKRARCDREHRTPTGLLSQSVRVIAEAIYQAFPHAAEVRQALTSRGERRTVEAAAKRVADLFVPAGDGPYCATEADKRAQQDRVRAANMAWVAARSSSRLRTALAMVVRARIGSRREGLARDIDWAIQGLAWGIGDNQAIADMAVRIYLAAVKLGKDTYGAPAELRNLARGLLLMVTPGPEQDMAERACIETKVTDRATGYMHSGYIAPWDRWRVDRDNLRGSRPEGYSDGLSASGGSVTWHDIPRGDGRAVVMALGKLTAIGSWRTEPPCDEPLYEAIADPVRGGRRYPLSKYIARRHARLFNMLVIDESHEASNNQDSAQARSAWRLAGLGLPTIAMTGTAMGGYAEQLWAAQIALDPAFREEFQRDQRGLFVDRYGFVKVQERDVDKRTGEVVVYGSTSDRVERETRILGNAPGVLPLFLIRYLLRISAVLHKADLALELPPCREIPVTIDPGPVLGPMALRMLEELKAQIKMDRFDSLLSGKLFGTLAHFATDYPLLASEEAGNCKAGGYEIRYPKNPELGSIAGSLVTKAPGLPRDVVLPMEQWMIDTCRAELAEGRRCMVMATSKAIHLRLRRLLEEALGEPVVYLDASKVDTGKREDWINENIVEPGVRVMIVNPVAIQTGLNPLVHFSTQLWLQNPGCAAVVYRQGLARVDRIGQKASETRIYTATYAVPAAQAAYALWQHKIAVSLATDGLDAGAALAAAGVGGADGARLDGYSVGKLIFALMTGEKTFKSRKHASAPAARTYTASGNVTAAAKKPGRATPKPRRVTQADMERDAAATAVAIAFGDPT